MSKRRLKIDVVIEKSREPIFVLDAKRRVVFFNQGCVDLSGWSAEDVLGLSCPFANESDRHSLASLTGALAPPQEIFAGETQAVPTYFVHRQTGQSVARLVTFYLLHDRDDDDPHVLGIISDLPKAKPAIEPSVLTQIHAELGALRHSLRQRYRLNSIVAQSPAMRRVLEQVKTARSTMASVAIWGAVGVGKEQIARAVHYESEHGAKAFVPLDCKYLPPAEIKDAIDRLLGSDWTEITPVSALHPGCVYFKHVDMLPRELQQRLVDFFDNDSGRAFRQQVRLMVSSNINLAAAVSTERLLETFYFQVSSLTINVPPLKERLTELRLLSQHFLEECNRTGTKQITSLATDVWPTLEEFNWPGNLDELRAVIHESYAACSGTVIQSKDLPMRFRTGLDAQSLGPIPPRLFEPLDSLLARTERQHVEAALQQSKGNKTLAAKLLGISRAALNARLQTDDNDDCATTPA